VEEIPRLFFVAWKKGKKKATEKSVASQNHLNVMKK
jgi:hypothetical protein